MARVLEAIIRATLGAVRVLFIAGLGAAIAGGCGHSSPRGQVSRAIAWPPDAQPVHVAILAAPMEEQQASAGQPGSAGAQVQFIDTTPRAFISMRGCDVIAYAAESQVPLPPTLASITLPGCWAHGVFVPWDREVCILGGFIRRDGLQIPVDGGFCYEPEAGSWRVVKLDLMPAGLEDGDRVDRDCRPVLADTARALRCSLRTRGHTTSPPGASFAERIPEESWVQTFRLVGLR